jgi:hypothetical protein
MFIPSSLKTSRTLPVQMASISLDTANDLIRLDISMVVALLPCPSSLSFLESTLITWIADPHAANWCVLSASSWNEPLSLRMDRIDPTAPQFKLLTPPLTSTL